MGYVYQQKPLPTDFKGVPVTVDVLDSNGNYRNIGTATTDATGMYSLAWTPDIPGNYTVTATFHGTNGYFASWATSSFTVQESKPTAAPTAAPPASMTDTYVLGSAIAIIVLAGHHRRSTNRIGDAKKTLKKHKQTIIPFSFFVLNT